MTHTDQQRAVIYCRVSGADQAIAGSWLNDQEQRCRKYVRDKGYTLDKVFLDDVSDGQGSEQHAGMSELLNHVSEDTGTNLVVVLDDLTILSDEVARYWELRTTLTAYGAAIESPNLALCDTPESQLVETILVARAQAESGERIEQRNWPEISNSIKKKSERPPYSRLRGSIQNSQEGRCDDT